MFNVSREWMALAMIIVWFRNQFPIRSNLFFVSFSSAFYDGLSLCERLSENEAKALIQIRWIFLVPHLLFYKLFFFFLFFFAHKIFDGNQCQQDFNGFKLNSNKSSEGKVLNVYTLSTTWIILIETEINLRIRCFKLMSRFLKCSLPWLRLVVSS